MKIYYLDEPLDEDELTFLKESIAQFEDIRSIQSMEQKRVPKVLPVPNTEGKFEENIEDRIELVKNSLIKAGIEKDIGNQVTWVLPKEMHWSALFQTAIQEVTGFSPYVAQRWHSEEEGIVKGEMRVLDGHGLFVGKG